MSNPGNTGQRYKNRKLVSAEVRGNKVTTTLECGHGVEVTWDTPKQAERVAQYAQARIGKRQRCNECEARLETEK